MSKIIQESDTARLFAWRIRYFFSLATCNRLPTIYGGLHAIIYTYYMYIHTRLHGVCIVCTCAYSKCELLQRTIKSARNIDIETSRIRTIQKFICFSGSQRARKVNFRLWIITEKVTTWIFYEEKINMFFRFAFMNDLSKLKIYFILIKSSTKVVGIRFS